MRLTYFFVLIFSAISGQAQHNGDSLANKPDENTMLWEISGNGLKLPSYLFGTFHLLCKEDIHLSPVLKHAIKDSKEVYLELDLDDPAILMEGLLLMNMKGGKKLKDLYTEQEFKRVANFFKDSLKTPIAFFQGMKPAFLGALLYPKMMPCNATASIEESIMQEAKAAGKEIKGLETMAFQASVFDSIPYEKQAEELLNTIDSMEKSRIYFGLMLNAYKNQRLDQVEEIINNPEFGSTENQDVLLTNRNKNWVDQLKLIVKNRAVFIAVGAGHLAGNEGLIALLRAEGFVVRPLINQ
jgi:uncharacterized protein YbaP (TraB family)